MALCGANKEMDPAVSLLGTFFEGHTRGFDSDVPLSPTSWRKAPPEPSPSAAPLSVFFVAAWGVSERGLFGESTTVCPVEMVIL